MLPVSLEAGMLWCDNCRRVWVEAAKAGWEQTGSLDRWRSMSGTSCSSPDPQQSQRNQHLGLHQAAALGHLLHSSCFHLLPGAEACPLSPYRLSLAVGPLLNLPYLELPSWTRTWQGGRWTDVICLRPTKFLGSCRQSGMGQGCRQAWEWAGTPAKKAGCHQLEA